MLPAEPHPTACIQADSLGSFARGITTWYPVEGSKLMPVLALASGVLPLLYACQASRNRIPAPLSHSQQSPNSHQLGCRRESIKGGTQQTTMVLNSRKTHRKAARVLERRPIRRPCAHCSVACWGTRCVRTWTAPPPTEPSTQPYYLTVHTSERRHVVMKETQPGSPVHLNNPMRFETCFTPSRSLLWRLPQHHLHNPDHAKRGGLL
jgi:hypothetical protein